MEFPCSPPLSTLPVPDRINLALNTSSMPYDPGTSGGRRMTEPAVIEPNFFEVIGTQRAMRRLKPDPVPDEYIKKIIWAATRAPSGGNRQGWRWLVVTDPASKKKIQEWYNEL